MSQKVNLIKDVTRTTKILSDTYRHLFWLRSMYTDNGFTVNGSDEIVQQDIIDAGYSFTPSELKAVIDVTAEAINLLMTEGNPSIPSDYDKKINAIIQPQG